MQKKQPHDNGGSRIEISRRTFLHNTLLTGGAIAGAGLFQTFTTMNVAHAAAGSFSFAWVSDTHLYPKTLNTRFIEKAGRAFKEIEEMAHRSIS